MHMAHLSGNTSGVSKSSSNWLNYTGFPGDMCVAFFNVPHGNKDAMMPNSLMKEESHRVYNCENERLLGVDRLSAWPIIGADIKHFTDYRYRPF